MVATRNLVYNFCMKKLLGILVLGIGIVLLIPDKTLACQATVDSSETLANDLRTCDDGDTLTITVNGSINRKWQTVEVPSGVNGATINNSGDLLSSQNTSSGIQAVSSTNLTINNYAGATIRSGGKPLMAPQQQILRSIMQEQLKPICKVKVLGRTKQLS